MIPCRVQRVVIFAYQVDFRKSFDGLLAAAFSSGFDPYKGDCVVFVKRDRSQVRVLVGDDVGLYLVYRRFEGGSLRSTWLSDLESTSITVAELSMLFDGVNFVVKKRVKPWRSNPARSN
jgi:transposase